MALGHGFRNPRPQRIGQADQPEKTELVRFMPYPDIWLRYISRSHTQNAHPASRHGLNRLLKGRTSPFIQPTKARDRFRCALRRNKQWFPGVRGPPDIGHCQEVGLKTIGVDQKPVFAGGNPDIPSSSVERHLHRIDRHGSARQGGRADQVMELRLR